MPPLDPLRPLPDRGADRATTTSRRGFLKAGALVGAGLVIGALLPDGSITAAHAVDAKGPFQAYVIIAPDSSVTVLSAHLEAGQGAYTGVATLVAEELDADWTQMRVEGAYGNPKLYGNLALGGEVQITIGSTTMASSFDRYRQAGAMARAMLAAAAAQSWNVSAGEIRIEKGVISHSSGQQASFGSMAEKAATMNPPDDVKLRDRKDWRLIGDEALHRIDHVSKTDGSAQFPLDVKLDGMLVAVLARPPLFGATARSFDTAPAKAVKGVVDVVQIARGVAVVADSTWAAIKGREALKVEWDVSQAETRGSAEIMADFKKLAEGTDAKVARSDGDAAKALSEAAKVVEAAYEFPYLAHAAMEPLDAVAWKHDGVIEIWGGHQAPDLYQAVAAQIAELPPERVVLHVMMTGGSFGRRAVGDADVVAEAVMTAKAIGWKAPVKLVWTREDDMTGGRYRPMYYHTIKAGMDQQGKLIAWQHRIVGQSVLADTPFSFMMKGKMMKDGLDPNSVEGAANLPYAVPNLAVDLVTAKTGVPVLWWRSMGHMHTAYAVEAFIDELAHEAGKDPIEYRLGLLDKHPRHRAVLEKVRDASGWGGELGNGKGRGVAVAESAGSFVAQVAEIGIQNGKIQVERVVCAIDCGTAVNPDVILAQMEGGIGFGLGAALKSEITLVDGVVQQTNFNSYEVLRFDEMPQVEVHIIDSTEKPTGVSGPGVPPIGPAVANAIFSVTGKRIRLLPLSKTDLSAT
jgi:isoquinoline 1-oxidoreductase beta subunit